ncbi:MAG: exported protein of unknown function [Candidatus Thorarchaeota archaeon]|nr:MAG: exported protein of unknown function [Candidatus Thorarchaeota archaeon]
MDKKQIFAIVAILLFTVSSGILVTQVQAYELDPGFGGGGTTVTTNFCVKVVEKQSSETIQGARVQLIRGITILQTGYTNSHGYFYFDAVTDTGNCYYKIRVYYQDASPTTVDTVVYSEDISGTYHETITCKMNTVHKWAVLVGLGDWDHDKFTTTTGYKDANDWYNRLTSLGFQHIKTLGDGTNNYDDQNKILATKSNVKNAISNVVTSADSNDVVVFVFAAHYGTLGMAVWDTNYYNALTYFTASWFGNQVDQCSANKIFTWIHACHAERFINNANTDMDSHELWMGSCKEDQVSFNDNFRQDFWQYVDSWGGLDGTALELIFDDLSDEYPKTWDGSTMEPVIYDGDTNRWFYL